MKHERRGGGRGEGGYIMGTDEMFDFSSRKFLLNEFLFHAHCISSNL